MNYVSGGYNQPKVQAAEYFDHHSLMEAITLPPAGHDFHDLLVFKIMDIQAELSSRADWNDIQLFITDFIQNHAFTTVNFEKFNLDLSTVLDEWYHQKGVPELFLKDIEYKLVQQENQYSSKLHFKVYNPSKTDGIISVINSPTPRQTIEIINYRIKAGECKEIKAWFDNITLQLLSTNLSLNIPSDILREHITYPTYTTDTTTGVFDINPSNFHPAPDEIIVDNTDENFTLIDSSGQRLNLVSLLKTNQERYVNHLVINNFRWKEMIDIHFHGKSIKSAFYKEAGKGKCKAEWYTKIPREGLYEIYAFLPAKSEHNYTTHGSGAQLSYKVKDNKQDHEIIIDASEENTGWISLGKFTFAKDQVSIVTLDDRGGNIDYSPEKKKIWGNALPPLKQIIIADAIKWIWIADSISE